MPAFEDLCRELFEAADERLFILQEELTVDSYSLDRTYLLSCARADEQEGAFESMVDIALLSDAANSAASMYEDVFDEEGSPLQAAWEVVVRWHGPAVSSLDPVVEAAPEISRAAGVDDVAIQATTEWDGARWVHRPTFEHSSWLSEDTENGNDVARVTAIAEDGLARLEKLARFWPLVVTEEEPEEEEPEP